MSNSFTTIYDPAGSFGFQDRFEVTFNGQLFGTDQIITNPDSKYFVKSVNIPNSSIDTNTVFYNGMDIKIASKKQQDTIVVTFYDTQDMVLRKFFDTWHTAIYNRSMGKLLYKNTYTMQQMVIQSFPFHNNTSYRDITFSGIFPTQIEDVAFDRDSKNAWLEFRVSFAYTSFYFSSAKTLHDSNLDIKNEYYSVYDVSEKTSNVPNPKESVTANGVSENFADKISKEMDIVSNNVVSSVSNFTNNISKSISSTTSDVMSRVSSVTSTISKVSSVTSSIKIF